MTIEDQIKDEKLQYGINREAAKISALSSGKRDKYEYLTGEEILSSNQQLLIRQAKFNYSPLGKAIKKQIKTTKDQGEKQVKEIQYNKDDYKDKLLLSKEREIFKDIYNKKLDKLEELNNKIDCNNLKYITASNRSSYTFSEIKDPIIFLNEIKKGEKSLEEAKITQENFLEYLIIIRKANKNAEQKKP